MAKIQVKTKINGEETEFLCQPYDTVLDVLRRDLNMTGTKEFVVLETAVHVASLWMEDWYVPV